MYACAQVTMVEVAVLAAGVGGLDFVVALRALRALRPLRTIAKLQGMRVRRAYERSVHCTVLVRIQ